jgi:nucleoside-diphosphate-sugar epimerase
MLMELAVRDVQRRGGIETVIVRPPWFYGPDQPPRQTLFFRMIREGKAPILGDGQQRRSMAYVDNLCQGLVLAERTPAATGETYWIADERPYTMNEIVDTVERLLEREFGLAVAHRRLRLPSAVGDAARAADALIQRAGFYHQKVHVLGELNRSIACSVEKARRELGYRPTIALEEGMRRSIRWCLDRGIAL